MEMADEYERAMVGPSPRYEALQTYYSNIKEYTYKLGCPEVGSQHFIDPHYGHRFCYSGPETNPLCETLGPR